MKRLWFVKTARNAGYAPAKFPAWVHWRRRRRSGNLRGHHRDQAHRGEAAALQRGTGETNEELRRFTQIVSHDLRAPLVSLKGFSTELRQSIETLRKSEEAWLANLQEEERAVVAQALQETIPEDLSFIESSVTRMDHLTGSLLQLSRVGHREFHMEELDAGVLLQEIAGSLAHQIHSRNIALEIGPLPVITSDRTAMEQIFGNLLDNAIKYLDPQRPGHIEVSAGETADADVFRVVDNGRGIAQDDMDKVFAPFRRAGRPGCSGEGMGWPSSRRCSIAWAEESSATPSSASERLSASCYRE